MDPIFEIELEDCPICRGVGAMQDEQGWCVSVTCMDCGGRVYGLCAFLPAAIRSWTMPAKFMAKRWNGFPPWVGLPMRLPA